MKAEELRIGNFVFYKGQIIKVTMVGEYGIQSKTEEQTINAKFIGSVLEAIPITEEWLIQLGFAKTNPGYYSMGTGLIEISIHLVGRCIMSNGIYRRIEVPYPIRYVHQVQNLWFTLTYTELKSPY